MSFMSSPTAQRMSCMEVWGGSETADAAVNLPGLDAWVYSRPYEQADAGGDVYYVSSCATGRINRLLVADVSGHGDKVRAIAIQLRDLMRRYVNFLDQSKFVLNMNGRFVESSAAGCFATAVVTTFFAPTRTLSVCNAGHPPPPIAPPRKSGLSSTEPVKSARLEIFRSASPNTKIANNSMSI
jgi:sigma-B regulation protein RsbU (phosphoserine phosphatase)